jgi:YD repeat-containing protein
MLRPALAAASALALLAAAVPAQVEAGTQYVYDSAGRIIQVTYSNGVTINYRYDSAGNRQTITTSRIANRSPIAVNDSAGVSALNSVDIHVRANDSDPDSDPITITGVSGVSGGGSVSILGGGAYARFTAPNNGGTKTFTYSIGDGRGGSASATVDVNVTAVNQPPAANDDSGSVGVGASTAIMVLNNDTDPNGDSLTVTAVGSPTSGWASIAPGSTYVYYTAPNTPGQYSFTYTISDGAGGTSTATVYMDVSSLENPECGGPGQPQCEVGP